MVEVISVRIKNSLENINYIFYDDNFCALVDCTNSKKIISELESKKLKLTHLFLTHEHSDHITGINDLIKKYEPEIISYENANNNQIVKLNEFIEIECILTPGHTFRDVSFMLKEKGNIIGIFSGDVLFQAGTGHVFDGDVKLLCSSIKNNFYNLNPEIILYSGHEYLENNLEFSLSIDFENEFSKKLLEKIKGKDKYFLTTFGDEYEINLFLRCDDKKIQDLLESDNFEETFYKLRELRNNW